MAFRELRARRHVARIKPTSRYISRYLGKFDRNDWCPDWVIDRPRYTAVTKLADEAYCVRMTTAEHERLQLDGDCEKKPQEWKWRTTERLTNEEVSKWAMFNLWQVDVSLFRCLMEKFVGNQL